MYVMYSVTCYAQLSTTGPGIRAAVRRHVLDSGWMTQIGTGRAVALTDNGRRALRDHLGLADDLLVTGP